MASLSVRELNGNISKALARVAKGETIDITSNGELIAEIRPKKKRRQDDPVWRDNFARLMEDLDKGVPFGRAFSHDERNG